jgi:hypothetical protein
LESIAGLLKRLQIRGQEVTSWHNKEAEIVGTHKRMGSAFVWKCTNVCKHRFGAVVAESTVMKQHRTVSLA